MRKLTNGGMAKVYKLYTFIAYLIPMAVLFFVRFGVYSRSEGAFGFWGIVVLMLCVVAFKNACLNFFKNYRLLSVSLVILIIGVFSEFLASELLIIGIVSSVGSIISLLFSVVSEVYEKHAYKTVDGEKVINKTQAIPQKQAWKEAYGYNIVDEEEIGE